MTIKMILAVDQGNAIGWADGRLPWKLKADMARFKELTTGHTVVMGFNTWKSLGRPQGLPNRKNIVLTRKPYMEARQHFSASADYDIISSLDYVKQQAARWKDRTFWIIGGASIYEEALALNIVDEIHLTLVHTDSGADVRLTTDMAAWKRFILQQRKAGHLWDVEPLDRVMDGDVSTSYLRFVRL